MHHDAHGKLLSAGAAEGASHREPAASGAGRPVHVHCEAGPWGACEGGGGLGEAKGSSCTVEVWHKKAGACGCYVLLSQSNVTFV